MRTKNVKERVFSAVLLNYVSKKTKQPFLNGSIDPPITNLCLLHENFTKANASDWDSGTRRLRNSERDFKYSVSHSQSPSGRFIFHVREVNELVHLLKV